MGAQCQRQGGQALPNVVGDFCARSKSLRPMEGEGRQLRIPEAGSSHNPTGVDKPMNLSSLSSGYHKSALGAPAAAPFQQGDMVEVRRDFGGGYRLTKGLRGKVVHIDGDGDALIDFPDDEEQWVHSSMFGNLQKCPESLPLCDQILQLLPSVAIATCGWNILVGVPEALYWHVLNPNPYDSDFKPTALLILAAGLASLPLIDCCGVQALLSTHASTVSVAPPLLFTLSALPSVEVRSACLASATAALGWSVAAVLGGQPTSPRRRRDGWAVLISLCAMVMIRWSFSTIDPFLTSRMTKVVLGLAGLFSAATFAYEEQKGQRGGDPNELQWDCGCSRGCFDFGTWPAAVATGLMGGSSLALFQLYLSSADVPATTTFSEPSHLQGLWTLSAVALGVLTLALVWCMTPWWLDTCQAALLLGLLPFFACALQCTSGESVEVSGVVTLLRGTGPTAHAGLLVLAAVFPFMLALSSKELSLLTKAHAAGRALFVAGLVWAAGMYAYYGSLVGEAAPFGGEFLQGKAWLPALSLGFLWTLGVFSAPNGASRPSVEELWYLSRHSGPPKREFMAGTFTLLAVLLLLFLVVAVPTLNISAEVRPPEENSLLIIGAYNVQQGYGPGGWPNVNCVKDLLGRAVVDVVGLSESNAVHPMTANNDVSLACASALRMRYFQGMPGALPTVGGGILSRLPTEDVSTSVLGPPEEGSIWVRAKVRWHGVRVDFHSVHLGRTGHASDHVLHVAEQIRSKYRNGPLVLVGDFGLPEAETVRPAATSLVELVRGTGLQEAFGALAENVSLPLPWSVEESRLRQDFIFHRGLELVGTWVHAETLCSNHVLLTASFRSLEGAIR